MIKIHRKKNGELFGVSLRLPFPVWRTNRYWILDSQSHTGWHGFTVGYYGQGWGLIWDFRPRHCRSQLTTKET